MQNPTKKSKHARQSSPSHDSPQQQARKRPLVDGSREQSAKRPKVPRRQPSFEIEDETQSDVDEKYETTSNTVESAGGGRASQGQPVKSTPTAMLSLCNKVNELVQERRLSLDDKNKLSHALPKMLTLDNEDAYDEEQMNAIHSLRHYYSAAVAHSHVPVLDAIATVEKFLENEPSAVQLHPHFPAKPSNPKNHYARVLAEKGQKSGGLAAISAKFKDEPGHPDVAAAINASVEESEAYPERLKHFVRDFQDDILPHQIPFINSLIRKHEAKAENDTQKDNSRGRPKKPVAAKTAFDIFKTQKEAMKDYASLSEKKRDEKIRAEFDKLPKDKLDFLESLAQK